MRQLIIVLVGLAVGLAGAAAEAQTYQKWSPPPAAPAATKAPPAESDPLKALVNEIDALIQAAEAQDAADPRFLEDLKAAIRPHQRFWSDLFVDETFADGDYLNAPAWTPVSGRHEVERAGLVISPRATAATQPPAAALLNRLLGVQPADIASSGAAIALDRDVPNTFLLDVILRAADLRDARNAAMRIGVTQGDERRGGYWVVLEPGDRPSVGLYMLSRSGLRQLAVADIPGEWLKGDDIRVQWQRRGGGLMRVFIDKARLIQVKEPTYQEAFDSLVLASDGMDVQVRRVRAYANR